jgi:hypothetical protein
MAETLPLNTTETEGTGNETTETEVAVKVMKPQESSGFQGRETANNNNINNAQYFPISSITSSASGAYGDPALSQAGREYFPSGVGIPSGSGAAGVVPGTSLGFAPSASGVGIPMPMPVPMPHSQNANGNADPPTSHSQQHSSQHGPQVPGPFPSPMPLPTSQKKQKKQKLNESYSQINPNLPILQPIDMDDFDPSNRASLHKHKTTFREESTNPMDIIKELVALAGPDGMSEQQMRACEALIRENKNLQEFEAKLSPEEMNEIRIVGASPERRDESMSLAREALEKILSPQREAPRQNLPLPDPRSPREREILTELSELQRDVYTEHDREAQASADREQMLAGYQKWQGWLRSGR